MQITRVETFLVPPRWCFVRIETDAGLVGWGEPIVEGRAATVSALVDEMSDYLIGKEPACIEDHWTVLFRGGYYRGGVHHLSAVAGLDQALWDIHGQRHGIPVHQLLGGPVRDRIRVYGSIVGTDPADLAKQACALKDHGLSLVKMNAVDQIEPLNDTVACQKAFDRVAAVRAAIGPEIGLGIDLHGRASRSAAKQLLRGLDVYQPAFIEEPVLSEHADCLSELVGLTSAPIALGERLVSRWDFKPILEAGHVDILQPDPCHAGGITETRKIAAMAECYDVSLALHCPLGPIALAANLQLAATCWNIVLQEQRLNLHDPSTDVPYLEGGSGFSYQDGFLAIPNAPGLGIAPDESAIRRAALEPHRWRNPVLRNADASFAEW